MSSLAKSMEILRRRGGHALPVLGRADGDLHRVAVAVRVGDVVPGLLREGDAAAGARPAAHGRDRVAHRLDLHARDRVREVDLVERVGVRLGGRDELHLEHVHVGGEEEAVERVGDRRRAERAGRARGRARGREGHAPRAGIVGVDGAPAAGAAALGAAALRARAAGATAQRAAAEGPAALAAAAVRPAALRAAHVRPRAARRACTAGPGCVARAGRAARGGDDGGDADLDDEQGGPSHATERSSFHGSSS